MIARDIVSKVRGILKMTSPDLVISDRLIWSVISPINHKLLSQSISRRKAWGVEQLYTTIPCLEMEEVPLYSCCDIVSECMIAKSKKELPEILESSYNLAIKRVSSIDDKVKFSELTTPERYANILKIYPNSDKRYYFLKNRYLYITDPLIESVTITAVFKDLVDPDEYSCGGDERDCPKNPLDVEFKTLARLEDDIVRLSCQQILSTFSQLPQQVNSGDGIENN